MKAALVVNRVTCSKAENIADILRFIEQAAAQNADLVLFAETATTGLANIDDREHDLALGVPVPGALTDELCYAARQYKVNVAIGLLELDGEYLYDTALLIDRSGEISFKYRRMSKGWHGPAAGEYAKEGTELISYEADFGRVCFLICGDLFDDLLVDRVRVLQPEYLLFPFARSFENKNGVQSKWDAEVLPEYIERIRMTRANVTLMANYLDEDCFGGAFAVGGAGEVIGSMPLECEGLLILEV